MGKTIRSVLNGVFMGMFEVVPGISGGTLAVLLNIYDKLILSISHIKSDFKNSIKYLAPILLGMAFGIYFFSQLVLAFGKSFPMEFNFLLLGLIIGLIPMILARAVGSKFKFLNTLPFFIMLVFMLVIIYFSIMFGSNKEIITDITLADFLKFVAVGALSSFCLMLPGCSGTMIMLVFGVYYTVMDAIHHFNMIILIPMAIGILFGILFGSKAIEYFFKKFPQATYFGILGLIVGSAISPCLEYLRSVVDIVNKNAIRQANMQGLNEFIIHGFVSVITLIVGMMFSYLFTKKAKEIEM